MSGCKGLKMYGDSTFDLDSDASFRQFNRSERSRTFHYKPHAAISATPQQSPRL